MDWILFDCDGVLLDSEAVVLDALVDCLSARFKPHVDLRSEISGLLGYQVDALLARLARRHQMTLDPRIIHEASLAVEDAHSNRSSPVLDVAWALEQIPQSKAVVSNSRLAHVRHALGRTGLERFFDGRMFSAEQVQRPKPSPDLYQHAVSVLGSSPERCLVIEDSSTGIAAALEAGMTVIGFTGGGHLPPGHATKQLSQGVACTVAAMRELPAAVAQFVMGHPENKDQQIR